MKKYLWSGLCLISVGLWLWLAPSPQRTAFSTVHAADQPQVALATPTGWISTNPGGGGAFSTVGAGPTGIVVACSDLSGIYVSRNRGQSWDIVGARQGIAATHASSVGFDPVDGNIILVGTDAGIFRSADGALSFTQVLNNGYIAAIQLARANPQIGYAAYHPMTNYPQDLTKAQVYKTTDRGQHWQVVSTNLPIGLHILKLAISPLNASIVYALSGQGRFATATLIVHVRFRDASNNVLCGGLGATDEIIFDLQAPKLAVVTSAAGQLHLQAEDQPGGSGVAEMEISTQSDFADASWQPWQETVGVEAKVGATVYVRVRDGAGNESAPVSTQLSTEATLYLPLITH